MAVRDRDEHSSPHRPTPGRLLRVVRRLACLVAALVAPLTAQAQPGRVTGLVTDSATAQGLASVQITLASGTSRLLARSGADGRYTVNNVPAGTYSLEALRLGFRRVFRANLVVTAGGTLTYNLRMEAAALSLQAVVTTGVVDPASGTRVPFTVVA